MKYLWNEDYNHVWNIRDHCVVQKKYVVVGGMPQVKKNQANTKDLVLDGADWDE